MVAVIGLWIGIGLLAIAILAIVISGIRGLVSGNVDLKKLGIMILPAVIWFILLLITGSWLKSGIITGLVMIVLMILAMIGTGIRGVFS